MPGDERNQGRALHTKSDLSPFPPEVLFQGSASLLLLSWPIYHLYHPRFQLLRASVLSIPFNIHFLLSEKRKLIINNRQTPSNHLPAGKLILNSDKLLPKSVIHHWNRPMTTTRSQFKLTSETITHPKAHPWSRDNHLHLHKVVSVDHRCCYKLP